MPTAGELPEHLVRALVFVATANAGGYEPTAAELDAYATSDEPVGPIRSVLTMTALATSVSGGMRALTPGDPVASYLARVGWIKRGGRGLVLTELGSSLVVYDSGSRRTRRDIPAEGVVLHPGDPAVLTVLTREVARAGAGLLADPYFREEHLEWLAQSTTISRVLTSSKSFDKKAPRGALELELDRLRLSRAELEIHISGDASFHDRFLEYAGSGEIHLIGASINRVGRNLTTIAPAPAAIQDPLQSYLRKLWADAEPVTPRSGIGRQERQAVATPKD